MGAVAFVMSGFTGIPYAQIAAAAIGPALLYYFCLFVYAELSARKLNIEATKVHVSGKQILLDAPPFVLPLLIMIVLLFRGYSLPFVGFWAIVSIVIIGLLYGLRKEARIDFGQMLKEIVAGIRSGSEMGVVCTLLGVITTGIMVSGLGVKLPLLIQDISGGHIIIALIIGAVASILIGAGAPTVPSYLLVAIGLCPALVKMGVPLLEAHFFPFMFAVFANLTPPVAIGPLVAARIAGADYWKTMWESCDAGITGLLLPFIIIYAPVIVLRPQGDTFVTVMEIIALILLIITIQVALSNYCLTHINKVERATFALSAALLLIFILTKNYASVLFAVALFVSGCISQLILRRKAVSRAL
jgi:TRAP-type uncharacterized transport system fused permease subunit